jgi:CheY-like chemotaxis protein
MGEGTTLEALFPGVRRMVLRAFFLEPDRWWSLPELAGKAGVQQETLRRYLAQLAKGGLIRVKFPEGHGCVYQPDPKCPVFADLQSMVIKLTSQTGGQETILVAEDQAATAQITRILLESWGYQVLEAHCPDEALALFDSQRGQVSLLLTDVVMPGMTGSQLAAELRRRNPELRVVYMSGYAAEQLSLADAAFLPKPFNPGSLSRMVRKELDRRRESRRHMKSS